MDGPRVSDMAVNCPLCKEVVPDAIINEHLDWCSSRVNCPACGELVHADEINAHLDMECKAVLGVTKEEAGEEEERKRQSSQRPSDVLQAAYANSRGDKSASMPEEAFGSLERPSSVSKQKPSVGRRLTGVFVGRERGSPVDFLDEYEISGDIRERVNAAVVDKYNTKEHRAAAVNIQRFFRRKQMEKRFESMKVVDSSGSAADGPRTNRGTSLKMEATSDRGGLEGYLRDGEELGATNEGGLDADRMKQSLEVLSEPDEEQDRPNPVLLRRKSTSWYMSDGAIHTSSKQTDRPETSARDIIEVENDQSGDAMDKSESGAMKNTKEEGVSPSPIRAQTDQMFSEAQCSTHKRKLLRVGVHKFNREPRRGLVYIIDKQFIKDPSAKGIADFLYYQPGLSKAAIGEYLGEPHPVNLSVLRSYVHLFVMENLELDVAVRRFMRRFRLPGEAQKIDRIMEEFSKGYCKENPDKFSKSDTAYVLAFSIILLNTDIHNPNVRRKMTLDDFIRNNRGIDGGKDLDPVFLGQIYKRIAKREFQPDPDHVTEVEEICDAIGNKCPDLAAPHRYFVMQAPVSEVKISEMRKSIQKKGHYRVLFLFNDVILCTKPANKRSSGVEGAACSFVYKNMYPLYGLRVQTVHSQNKSSGFMLVNESDIICMFSFIETEYADEFISMIGQCIEELKLVEEDRISEVERTTLGRQASPKPQSKKARDASQATAQRSSSQRRKSISSGRAPTTIQGTFLEKIQNSFPELHSNGSLGVSRRQRGNTEEIRGFAGRVQEDDKRENTNMSNSSGTPRRERKTSF
eukprot:Nk52_evm43s208 gene=Nk52_evmTU43s208